MKYEEHLDLSNYIDDNLCQKKYFTYDLYAVNECLSFSKNNGHYYSFIKINNIWYKFDDENFEKNASALLHEMRKESSDMSVLLNGLTEKMQGLSVPGASSVDQSLEAIRTLMISLNDQVRTVSDTLARMSEEA